MGADEVEGADRTSASAAQAVRERVEAVRAGVDIAQALGSDDSVIDLKTFQKLKAAFDEADVDAGGDLCVDEFVLAFQMVIPEVDEAKLRHLFTRIDASDDIARHAPRRATSAAESANEEAPGRTVGIHDAGRAKT